MPIHWLPIRIVGHGGATTWVRVESVVVRRLFRGLVVVIVCRPRRGRVPIPVAVVLSVLRCAVPG